ncbi:PREDICTED: uncharacterized protein LOC108750969 [Trachymyrmex septentrionalis]|uniref:uncharacterized protein LOC108750969 n=1 Tax=Trachymyrmex septentrionalis TaxID=34720 RepID=UPI00084F25AB|nr:PREDICTED: uncharacterized protein LOC108750969 [Trachymyrmex septentrionalis]
MMDHTGKFDYRLHFLEDAVTRRFNTELRVFDKDCKTGANEEEEPVSGTGEIQTRNLGQGSRKTEPLNDVRGIYGRTPNGLGRFGEITNTWRDVKRGSRKTEPLNDVRGIYGRTPNGLGRFGEITNTWRDVKRVLLHC